MSKSRLSGLPRNSWRENLPNFPMTSLQSPTTDDVIPWQNSHNLLKAFIRSLVRRLLAGKLNINNEARFKQYLLRIFFVFWPIVTGNTEIF